MVRATARHILVETEEACVKIKAKIAAGADFAEMAEEHSHTNPSLK
jgi:peptidyl-prolyl cis-trans isomerase C